jgi:hypothetical protein
MQLRCHQQSNADRPLKLQFVNILASTILILNVFQHTLKVEKWN